jgi:putative hemolysin
LQQAALAGDAKARAALKLAENPNRFLSTVQMGITLIGILSGAFGGAALSKSLAVPLKNVPALAPYADSLSFGLVVLVITYLSLIIGELVPKRLALGAPEKIAGMVAGPMSFLSMIGAPFVSLLTVSSDLVLRLLGVKNTGETPVTEAEINVMIEQGTQAGVFDAVEQNIVARVFALGDRKVESLMTRRPNVMWVDREDSPAENRSALANSPYSRVLVCDGDLDHVVGIVAAKALLKQCYEERPLDLMAACQQPLFVPESVSAFNLLEKMKSGRTHIAVVVDEHGATQGLITMHDILSAVVGEMPAIDDAGGQEAVQREDGSWLVDGLIAIQDFKSLFDLKELPGEDEGNFTTLSGFILYATSKVPKISDSFDAAGLHFEIMDMDGQRIDRVLVKPIETTTA